VRSVSRPAGITQCTTGRDRNHAQHTTTLPRTGNQHNGPPYHTCTTGNPHTGRAYHTCITGFGTPERAQRAFRKRNSLDHIEIKVCRPRAPDAERPGVQLPRARPKQCGKKPMIARAQRSAATPCSATRSPRSCATRIRRPHRHSSTPARRASIGTTRSGNHALHNGPQSEPRASGITSPITGNQHNGLAYHALHNGPSAQRAVVPHLHNELLHDGDCTTSVQEGRFVAFHQNRNVDHAATGAER